MNKGAIGIFDSGLGGLSVWKELIQLLPNESTIYYADRANCPYGDRSPEEIIQLCERIVEFLIQRNCKLIVVACNTATAAAIDWLRSHFDLPFVGMEPAIKPAALQTKTGKIGVIATRGTLQGTLFQNTSQEFAQGVSVQIEIGDGLVELAEAGQYDSDDAELLLRKYLKPMLQNQVDQIVLGCTHYPLFLSRIEKIVGAKARIINPTPAVAKQARKLILENELFNSEMHLPIHFFHANGSLKSLKDLVSKIREENFTRHRHSG